MHPNNYQFKELSELESFEPSSLVKDVSFTQADFYGNWQKFFRRVVKRYVVTKNNEVVAYFQLIKYPLIGNKSYIYIPYGPVTKDFSLEFYTSLKSELVKIAKQLNSVFIRLDFTPTQDEKRLVKIFKKSPAYTYHSAYFQPRVEWFLELNKSENELYESMHKDTRYSIRLTERREVSTEIITENFNKYFEEFYRLMNTTAKRDNFSLHPKDYYKSIFDNLKKGMSFLAVAQYQNKILAIDLIITYGNIAHYVFACSSNEERNRAPAYSAIWKSICQAKSLGYKYFNFGGISSIELPNKSWEGLTNFKKKFGGIEIKHSEFYDLVIDKLTYHLYNLRKLLKHFIIKK